MKRIGYCKNFITKLKVNADRVLFPRHLTCLICDKELFDFDRYNICAYCISFLEMNTHFCEICGRPIQHHRKRCGECIMPDKYFEKARSAVCYDGLSKHMIHALKFNGVVAMVKAMAMLCVETYISNDFNCEVVTFVPATQKSLKKERGFNQAELIASMLASELSLEIFPLLKKVKETKGQGEVEYIKRKENIINAFEVCNKENLRDKTVLLVDDVYTSGATVDECAKKLVRAGAKSVFVLTFAATKSTMNENKAENKILLR